MPPRPSPLSLTGITAALRLNGVETKNHAIFTELTRVKQYMEKIQKLEAPPQERENTVNTEAAARVIKSGLVSHRVAALAARLYSLARRRVTTKKSRRSSQSSSPERKQKSLPRSLRRNAHQRKPLTTAVLRTEISRPNG